MAGAGVSLGEVSGNIYFWGGHKIYKNFGPKKKKRRSIILYFFSGAALTKKAC